MRQFLTERTLPLTACDADIFVQVYVCPLLLFEPHPHNLRIRDRHNPSFRIPKYKLFSKVVLVVDLRRREYITMRARPLRLPQLFADWQ